MKKLILIALCVVLPFSASSCVTDQYGNSQMDGQAVAVGVVGAAVVGAAIVGMTQDNKRYHNHRPAYRPCPPPRRYYHGHRRY